MGEVSTDESHHVLILLLRVATVYGIIDLIASLIIHESGF